MFLALHRFFPVLERQHVLVRTDSTAAVAYISRIGGMRSRRMSQLARRLLLWSHPRLKSLHAIHIQASSTVQPMRSHGSLASWRMETPPRVCSADMGAIRGGPDRSVCFPRERSLPVVFFPDRGLSRHGCTGPQLASGHAQVCVSPSEPARAVTVQGQGGRGTGSASCAP